MSRRNKRAAHRPRALESGGGAGEEAPLPPPPPVAEPPPPAATHTAPPAGRRRARAPRAPAEPEPTSWTPRTVTLPPLREVKEDEDDPPSLFERILALPLGRLSPLLSVLSIFDTCPFRGVCRSAEAHVASYPWANTKDCVKNLRRWRAAFPVATAVKMCEGVSWSSSASLYLAGVTGLNISGVTNGTLLKQLRAAGVFARLTTAKLLGLPDDALFSLLLDDTVSPATSAAASEALLAEGTPVTVCTATISALVSALNPGLPALTIAARLDLLAAAKLRSGTVEAVSVCAGGIGRAVSLLRAYKTHVRIVGAATGLLYRFMLSPLHADAVALAGPTPALLDALDAYPDDADVTYHVCTVLARLLPLSPATARVMLTYAAPRIILCSYRGCLSDAFCAMAWCTVLETLIRALPVRAVPAIMAVPGAVDKLFDVLGAQVDDPQVAACCLACLEALANHLVDMVDSGGDSFEAVSAALRGSVGAIVAAAATHYRSGEVLLYAISLLLYAVAPMRRNANGARGIDVYPLIAAGAAGAAPAAAEVHSQVAQKAYRLLQLLLLGAPEVAPRLLVTLPIITSTALALTTAPTEQQGLFLCVEISSLMAGPTSSLQLAPTACLQLASPAVVAAVSAILCAVSGDDACIALTLLLAAARVDPPAVAATAGRALVQALGVATSEMNAAAVGLALAALRACAAAGAAAAGALVVAGATRAMVGVLEGGGLSVLSGSDGVLALNAIARCDPGSVEAAGGADLLRKLSPYGPWKSSSAPGETAGAVVVGGGPEALLQQAGAATVVVDATLAPMATTDVIVHDWVTCIAVLLESGAPASALADALTQLRPAFRAALGASRAAMANTGVENEQVTTASEFLVAGEALIAAVAAFAAAHPELARQLAGW